MKAALKFSFNLFLNISKNTTFSGMYKIISTVKYTTFNTIKYLTTKS